MRVSHHLGRLQAETGAQLLERAGRGIRLTPEGVLLARRAAEVAAFQSALSVLVPPACDDAGFTPHIAYTSDDIIVDQALVAAGLGVTTMPGLALSSYQVEGVQASELTNFRRRVYVATYGEPPDPPATTAFVTALRSTADACPPQSPPAG